MREPQRTTGRRKVGSENRTVTPLYHQVYVVLREKIRAGEFDPDRPLPGEHQLAGEFGVSRVTIRRTLQNLELDGLVIRKRGVGTFPVPRPVEFRDRYNIGGLLDPSGADHPVAKSRTLSMKVIASPAHISDALNSDPVLRIERVRSIKRQPFTLLTVYLPSEIAEQLDRKTLRSTAALIALEQGGFALARSDQSISARAADDVVASLLKVPVGSPLIFMFAFFAGKGDEPLAVMEGLFRPDLYEYRTSALRRGTGQSARWTTLI